MIKRIIGILATLAILALVVFTALGSGSYKSMLPEDLFLRSTVESADIVAEEVVETENVDSLSFETDSLQLEVVE
jgi:hypothetical protein